MKTRAFLIPFLVGAFLRLLFVWSAPLWYDENFTLAMTRLPLLDMLTAIEGDVHPPLFYLLIRPLGLLDLPAWTLRLFSVAFGIAALPLAWIVFGQLSDNPKTRTLAFWLFSLCTTAIYYSQEARMYALLTCLLLAAAWALLARRWAWLTFFAALLPWTQNYGLFYIAALGLAGLIRDRRDLRPLVLSLGVAVLAYLPWLPILLDQMEYLGSGYWIPPFHVGTALYDLYRAFIQKGNFRLELFGLVVFWGWMSYAFWWSVLKRQRTQWISLALALAPWLISSLFSAVSQSSVMHFRSLVPLAPFTALFLSGPISHTERN